MNSSADAKSLFQPRVEPALATFSRLLRRIHMFTGLFLGPWMLMYALSTLVMSSDEFFHSLYSSKNPAMVKERELDYARSFPSTATREQIAQQILEDIGLDGTHSVGGGKNGKPLVINQQHALTPRRITFDASKNTLLIEREEFRSVNFLERMHRRRGYSSYAIQNIWGSTVDLAVVAMMFWSLSGTWLWWELRSTRFWGLLSFAAGLVVFGIFMVLI